MIQYLPTHKKIWLLAAPLGLFLLHPFSTDLAIPGPIPVPVQEEVAVKTPSPPPEPVRSDREEKIFRILSGFHTGLKSSENEQLVTFISEESRRYGFDPELILALISTESSFYNWSVSKKGALGLMQIVPTTGRQLAEINKISWQGDSDRLFDPLINVKLGIHYLYMLNRKFSNLQTALTAYNFGPSRVKRWVRKGRAIPTGYANKVLRSYQKFLALDTEPQGAAEEAEAPAKSVKAQDAEGDISQVSIRS
ncbi:MAG: lytic transglycosylase domain-containing protein [Nitrospiria bacterium]